VDEEKARIVRTQASLRFLNERAELIAGRTEPTPMMRLRCECGREGCTELVAVHPREYETIRSDARCFLVAPGHAVASVEKPILRSGRFDVVRVEGIAAALASELASRPSSSHC
jgi:hypothetical protein